MPGTRIAVRPPTPGRPDAGHLAFEAFVLRHGSELVAFARRLGLDHHRAEDVVQDALARCARSWPSISRAENPRAYVYRAVVNAANSWWRRRASREQPTDDLVDDRPDDAALFTDRVEARDQVQRALAELTSRQRAVLVLRYYVDATDDEIASILGCPISTVRSHARRGLVRLSRTIGHEPGRETSR